MSDGNNNITTGEILEVLNTKVDLDLSNVDNTSGADVVIEFQTPTAENGYTWYRKYKSGWVEQGGFYDRGSYSQSWNTTINLPVKMANAYYTTLVSGDTMNDDHLGEYGLNTEARTTTDFKIYFYTGANVDQVRCCFWEVKGMAA